VNSTLLVQGLLYISASRAVTITDIFSVSLSPVELKQKRWIYRILAWGAQNLKRTAPFQKHLQRFNNICTWKIYIYLHRISKEDTFLIFCISKHTLSGTI
jgi:hypothetical protein